MRKINFNNNFFRSSICFYNFLYLMNFGISLMEIAGILLLPVILLEFRLVVEMHTSLYEYYHCNVLNLTLEVFGAEVHFSWPDIHACI